MLSQLIGHARRIGISIRTAGMSVSDEMSFMEQVRLVLILTVMAIALSATITYGATRYISSVYGV